MHDRFSKPFPQRLIAYIDVLGWTELIRSGADVRIFGGLSFLKMGQVSGTPVTISNFSDTIVCSCAPTVNEAPWLIRQVQLLCMGLLRFDLYTRGALSLGELAHAEGMLAGRALTEAHALERDVAKYPRLVISDEVASLLAQIGGFPGPPHQPRALNHRAKYSWMLAYLDSVIAEPRHL
jgi:hypothetical protein